MLDVKYATFREPVLGLLSPDFVYVYINRIETNYPVCRLYQGYDRCGNVLWGIRCLIICD